MAEQEQQLSKKERKKLKKQQRAEQQQKQEQMVRIKKWATYGLIGVVILAVGWFLFNQQVPVPEEEKNKPVDQVLASDWVKGNPEAEVVLVEFSDYQCPACKAYEELVGQIESQYGETIAIVYRHYPLRQIHKQADLAAQAAEAAGKQGMFWEMHDKIFAGQEDWSDNRNAKDLFVQYAQDLGLDVGQFETDLNSKEVQGLVQADYMNGLSLQVNATPTFFLNGVQITNPASLEEFAGLIQESLPATESSTVVE